MNDAEGLARAALATVRQRHERRGEPVAQAWATALTDLRALVRVRRARWRRPTDRVHRLAYQRACGALHCLYRAEARLGHPPGDLAELDRVPQLMR